MADFFVDGIAPVAPRTIAERHTARRAVAGYATDAEDLRHLLDILALWPANDAEALPRFPSPSWDGGRR